MIINLTTKQAQQSSAFPDTNWMGEGWALVPTELEEKAWGLSPFCIITLDADGALASIEDDTEARTAWEEALRKEQEAHADDLSTEDMQTILKTILGVS